MERAEWQRIERLLVVRLDNIGDVILMGPALRALRRERPGLAITALVSTGGAQIARMVPGIDDVIVYDAEWQRVDGRDFDPERTRSLVEEMRSRAFDAALILTSFSQSPHPAASVCFLAGIPRRIGQSKEFAGALLTHWVTPLDDAVHLADRNLYLLETTGIPSAGTRLALEVPDAARDATAAILESHGLDRGGEPLVLVAPGASCSAPRYPGDRLAEAMRLLAERQGARIVVVGSARETAMTDEVVAATPGAVSLAGLLSVSELCALVERAALVICQNSAPLHIADALDRPMLVLYSGAEDIEQWRPRHAPSVLLNRAAECAPCHLFECERSDMRCLDIPPEEVADRASRLLGFSGRRAVAPPPEPSLVESLR